MSLPPSAGWPSEGRKVYQGAAPGRRWGDSEPMIDVRAMCAIGQRGQLGLHGRLPWEGNTDPLYVEDVTRFFAVTQGHVLIAGPKTIEAVPDFAYRDRTIAIIRSHEDPRAVLARYPGRRIYVGGGIAVWNVYAPFIQQWDITRLPYDGEADRWFDPAWLVGRGRD